MNDKALLPENSASLGRRKREQKRWQCSGVCVLLAVLMALSLLASVWLRPNKEVSEQISVFTNVTSISNSTSNVTRPLDLVVMIDASASIKEFTPLESPKGDWSKEVRFADEVITSMGKLFFEKGAGFRAALGQFSTSAYVDVGMAAVNTTEFHSYDGLTTWAGCQKGDRWDDNCKDDADYKACSVETSCILRRTGFTEIGAALCGPRPAAGMRTQDTCEGGALGSLIAADTKPDNFEGTGVVNITDQCNDPRMNTPLKVVLLVTDGKPKAPGICPNTTLHCRKVNEKGGVDDAALASKLIKAAWWMAAGTPKLFGIYVGNDGGEEGKAQLKAISSCCDHANTVIGKEGIHTDRVHCDTDENSQEWRECPYYIYEENFDELLASVADIVAKLANFETNLCVTETLEYKPTTKLETHTREIPATQLLWLLLLLIPCIMAICWGWILRALANAYSGPTSDDSSLELIDQPERGECAGPHAGEGSLPGTGAAATMARKKGAFGRSEDEDGSTGGSSSANPKKKGAFSRPEDDDEGWDDLGMPAELGAASRPKGKFGRPGEDDEESPLGGHGASMAKPKRSMAGPGDEDLDFSDPATLSGQRLPNGKYPWRASPRGAVMTFKKPGTDGIVVNLETPDGNVEMPLPKTANMNELHEKIKEATNLEPEDQLLCFDPEGKQPVTDRSKLSGYNIKDGTTIHLTNPLPNGLTKGFDGSGKLPGPNGIVVNLVTPEGTVPLTLPEDATFADLQEKIRGATGVEEGPQILAFDPEGKEPVTKEPGLTGFDIQDGTQLYLKPKLGHNPGPFGTLDKSQQPGQSGMKRLFKGPGDTGVKTGMVICCLETAKGTTEVELPLTATWDELQRKLRNAAGMDEDPTQWALVDGENGQPLVNAANRGKHSAPLADFDIQDGTQLLLIDPDVLDKNAGGTGMMSSMVPVRTLNKNRKVKTINIFLSTDKGDVPVSVMANAPLSAVQAKAEAATGIAADMQMWARDKHGQQPLHEDPTSPLDSINIVDGTTLYMLNHVTQALVGASGTKSTGVKMLKIQKTKSGLGASMSSAYDPANSVTITNEDPEFGGDLEFDLGDYPTQGNRGHGLTEWGDDMGQSFDLGEGHGAGPASFAFIVEPKDLPPEYRKFAFNPWPVVMLSSALLPASLYLSGAFDFLLAAPK